MNQPQPVRTPVPLYEVERRAYHAERPGFRIAELQLSQPRSAVAHPQQCAQIRFTFWKATCGCSCSSRKRK